MISLSMASYLTSYVYPLRLAIFHPQIYTFVDCNHLLAIHLVICTDFTFPNLNASANPKKISSLPSSDTQVDCRCDTAEFNRWYLTWQPFQLLLSSASKRLFTYSSTTNRLMKIRVLNVANIQTRLSLPSRPLQRLFRYRFPFFPFICWFGGL